MASLSEQVAIVTGAATGIGYEWFTPILGLLKFAIAYPLNDEDDDDTELFAFTFGTSF